MQSLSGKLVSALLCAVFHSPLIHNAEFSNHVGKKTMHQKSHYKPPKDFLHSVHPCGKASYEVFEPKTKENDLTVFMFHGGGYKVKLIDAYRKLSQKYSRIFGNCRVLSLDYRIFPEQPFPAQLEDAALFYKTALEQGINPNKIVFVGDSAGANLALAFALYLRDNHRPMPSGIVCFSLWGDMNTSGDSYIKNAYRDPFCGIARRKKVEENLPYLRRISAFAKDLDRSSVYASPSFADFTGFPPVTLVCGEAEMGESDSDIAYQNMKKVGVDAVLYKYEGMFHDFQLFPFFPESKDAYAKVWERIKNL